MSNTVGTIPPAMSWAQRRDLIFVIIDVECKDFDYKLTDKTFNFKGVNKLDSKTKYDVTLTFYGEIDTERSFLKDIDRCLEFTIYKKNPGPYWPSLTTDKTKLHFLKTNFSKWVNESGDENEMNPCMGMGQFDNLDNFDNFDNLEDEEDEDSDDNIPSLTSKDDEE